MALIRQARFPDDTEALLKIWREFVASPSVSLSYQRNEYEFKNLPGKYALPDGRILIGEVEKELAGCIAFRKVSASICEMKRLYVRPRARGMRLGEALVASLIEEARQAGYQEMRLDVLAEFKAAQELYAKFGFRPADPISFNPLPGTKFLGLHL
jgi:ribosomal protein S18 acetylase RimI-like enzyme